jgi:hypothetical protein
MIAVSAGCSSVPGDTLSPAGRVPLSAMRARTISPVACSAIGALRDLRSSLQYANNSSTGDTMDYVVVGDGAKSADVLVMFPGTGQILPIGRSR